MSGTGTARSARRSLLGISAAVLLVWAVAIALQQWRTAASEPVPAIADASWIWATGPWKWRVAPAAFLAACDFDLPASAPGARMLLLADEAVLVWVNGRLVASGEYRGVGDGLGTVPLGDRLRAGGNRVVAQLRSGRGPGGFLAAIEPGLGQPVACASGPSWRIFRSAPAGLLAGWAPLSTGEQPVVWGRPPVGRWGALAPATPWPRWDRVLAGGSRLLPPGSRRGRAAGMRARAGAGEPRGAQATDVIFDWGEEVQGILEVTLVKDPAPGPEAGGTVEVEPAVVRFSIEPPPADGVEAALVIPAGERRWRDAVPRRFRYARVVGFVGIDRAAVLAVPPELVAPAARPPAGVLGIEPPPSHSAVAEEIRRRLNSLPARAAGGRRR